MKKLFDSGVLHFIPTEDGIIFVALHGEYADKAIVMYRHCNIETGEITTITRSVYLLNKFGNNFKQYEDKPSLFLNVRTTMLPGHKMLIFHPLGEASITAGSQTIWKGDILNREHGPSGACVAGNDLWISFPEGNAIARYNLRNMREDLRIGSEHSSELKSPEGLWPAEDGSLLVCTGKYGKILKVDLSSYVITDYLTVDEPIHQYAIVNGKEIIRLDSGIYEL